MGFRQANTDLCTHVAAEMEGGQFSDTAGAGTSQHLSTHAWQAECTTRRAGDLPLSSLAAYCTHVKPTSTILLWEIKMVHVTHAQTASKNLIHHLCTQAKIHKKSHKISPAIPCDSTTAYSAYLKPDHQH